MKRIYYLLWMTVFFAACKQIPDNQGLLTVRLDGNWQFRQADSSQWLPALVPGTVHTDLLDHKMISDPFYRMNETDVQWIDKTDWEYQTFFIADHNLLKKVNQELVFEGLDTFADVYLNDQLVLKSDNMFRTWKVDCRGKLKKGKNELRILFHSPVREGLKRLEANGFPLPADNDQSERGGIGDKKVSPFVRKVPYHFGWDWGPRLVTSGIWRPVLLEAWDGARFEDLYIEIEGISEKVAELNLHPEIRSDRESGASIDVYMDSILVKTEQVTLQEGPNVLDIALQIPEPVFWWPNGMGSQRLYSFRLEMAGEKGPMDRIETRSGIRTVELVRTPDPDGAGSSFYFEVNGMPVFAKGANYIPNDVFLTRVTPGKYEFIVKSAADAHMNMLRVWGGGIYEDDLFYDLCDRYGILVWQDFMFACAMVPGDDAYLENVRMEAIDNVKRLRNHPSLALWCGNNEIEVAWAEWEEGRGWGWKQRHNSEQRKAIWEAYDTLFHKILPEVVNTIHPDVAYWPSSPSAGPGKLASYETRSGDMHYWGVWHGLHPFSDYRKYRARFMSEYGFQSFPEFSSVKKYTIPEDWDIESDVMMAHQRSGIGNLRIRQYMEPQYLIPDDFEEFLYVGQLLQAEAIKMAIESHRSDRPYCMGTLYWQLNDCWPVASWSGIDYYGRWKALHYFVKESLKPVALVVEDLDGKVRVHIVSDLPGTEAATLKVKLIRFDGQELWKESIPVQIPAGSSSLYFEKDITGIEPAEMVLVTTLGSGSTSYDTDLHYFAGPKDLKLTDPGITLAVNEERDLFKITLTSRALAKNVFLTVDGLDGQFSDNFFDVLPGEEVIVTFPKSGTLQGFRGGIRLLHLYQTNH